MLFDPLYMSNKLIPSDKTDYDILNLGFPDVLTLSGWCPLLTKYLIIDQVYLFLNEQTPLQQDHGLLKKIRGRLSRKVNTLSQCELNVTKNMQGLK